MRRRKPDNSRMKEALGRELVPLSEGILKTAEFQRAQTAETSQ
jgi:nucleoside-diphosphate-sugar epimerase